MTQTNLEIKNQSEIKRSREEIIDDIIKIQTSCIEVDSVNTKTGNFDDDKFAKEVIALIYSEYYK